MMRKGAVLGLFMLLVFSCRFQQIRIDVTFDGLNGLAKDDRVLFEGNAVGNVTSVQYNPDGGYTVQVAVDKGFAHTATEYSQFFIVNDSGRLDHKAVEMRLTRQGGTPLASGAAVKGEPLEKDLGRRLQEDLQSGFSFFKEQIEQFGHDFQHYPESDTYQRLKESLEDLAAEIEQKEKQAREKIKREWLPNIQRELDDLRERLKRFGREEELTPLDKEVERIRRI